MTCISIADLQAPILVIVPHPDDETLGCGGLIALASEAGVEVTLLFVTDGRASHPASKAVPPDAMAALRADEAEQALERLGAAHQPRCFLGLRDGDMPRAGSSGNAAAVDAVATLFHASRFGTVVAPWRRDPHTDHRISWQITTDAMKRFRLPLTLLEYHIWLAETGSAADWPEDDEVEEVTLDIASVVQRKHHALEAHRSQLGLVVGDDPNGFVLSPQTIARLVTDHETFWVTQWPDP